MVIDSTATGWTPSESTKFLSQLLVPILLAILGFYLTRLVKRLELSQWRNQRLIDKRIAIYDSLASDLNDLLCYFTFVGIWKDLTPPEVVKMKRSVDKKIYLAAPLFSPRFLDACMAFMHLCYAPFQGWGLDAKMRTPAVRRKESAGHKWKKDWDECFSDDTSDPAEIRKAYQRIMQVFSDEIGIAPSKTFKLGRHPTNIK